MSHERQHYVNGAWVEPLQARGIDIAPLQAANCGFDIGWSAHLASRHAGAPLKLPGGQNVGTLCLIDSKPRTLDDIDLAILGSLRDLAVEELVRCEHGHAAP